MKITYLLAVNILQNCASVCSLVGCNMSLKIHVFHLYLDFFSEDLCTARDDHEEHFHQDILMMESRYQGGWSAAILVDYYWILRRNMPNVQPTRKSIAKKL
ncbi:hypothetical protein QYM36_000036 [Artemia franciscana]|uniref:Uncharacterized protein n=1 Tax=Artemia franciscana TaxID=6661 RepID=A0AA88LKK9_ARTSF|nr:hypothetical protein QYM36_000036 [Artemia franciscana]